MWIETVTVRVTVRVTVHVTVRVTVHATVRVTVRVRREAWAWASVCSPSLAGIPRSTYRRQRRRRPVCTERGRKRAEAR